MLTSRHRLRVLLAAMAIVVPLFAAGCRKHRHHDDDGDGYYHGDGGSRYDDRYEPNDTQYLAYNLGGPNNFYAVNGAISWDSEEDWFTFWQDDGYDITLSLTNLPDDYELQLYDDDGHQLAVSSQPGLANELIFFVAPYSGRYYVRVQGWDTAHDEDRPYLLEVDLE